MTGRRIILWLITCDVLSAGGERASASSLNSFVLAAGAGHKLEDYSLGYSYVLILRNSRLPDFITH